MARKRRPPRPGALADLAPLRILRKILFLQAAYYFSACVLIIFTVLVAGKELGLDLLLSWRTIRADTTVGWMLAFLWLLNSLVSVIFIMIFVARSKLVPDFAITVHLIHFFVTVFYTRSIPTAMSWWLVQAASTVIMTVGGVWSCQWRELRPITFFGSSSGSGQRQGDLEGGVGFHAGRGGGGGPDGGPSYELVERGESV